MNIKQDSKTKSISKLISLLLVLTLAACSMGGTGTSVSTPPGETKPIITPTIIVGTATTTATPTIELSPTIQSSPTEEPTKPPKQILAQFKESVEYKKGLQDYLNAMGLNDEIVKITEEVKIINGKEYQFLVASPDQAKLTPEQQKYPNVFNSSPLFVKEEDYWRLVYFIDLITDNKTIGTSVVWKLLERLPSTNTSSESVINYENLIKGTNSYSLKTNWYDFQPESKHTLEYKNIGLNWGINQFNKVLDTDLALSIRGQELLYYLTVPEWINNHIFSKDEMNDLIQNYLNGVMGHFSGKVKEWIVVNEPYDTSGKWAPYRDDPFYRAMGEDYIIEAFRIAREADPSAILIYNDTGNHAPIGVKGGETTASTQKRVEVLRKEELIDKVGIQMHMFDDSIPNKDNLISVFKSYGVPVVITELDVDMSKYLGSDDEKYLKQAEIYRIIICACIESNVCDGITFWEPGDSNNWRESVSNSSADASFLDDNLNPKPAYYAMLAELYALFK